LRLLCDEGVERQIVESLRSAGHVVSYIAESDPGLTDEAVLALANESGALLVTNDKDFGELVFRRGLISQGVMLLRLAGMAPVEKGRLVAAVVAEHEVELQSAFCVVTSTAVRIRPRSYPRELWNGP
jgi:predicted nuclease of predicted toxin-antitoxin system